MSNFNKAKIAAFGLVFCVAVSANAGSKGATEVTQLLNNAELVVQVKEQIKSNKKQLEQYATQLSQFRQQIQDGTNINPYYTKLGLVGLEKEIDKAHETRQAYEKLFGTVDQLSTLWQQRMYEASTTGIPMAEYVKNEADRIQKGNELAIKRIEQERRVMSTIEEDFSLAKKWGDSISYQSGINGSLGLLNTQMNRMLQQNARMIQIMAQAQGSDKARLEAKKAEDEAQAKTLMRQHNARNNEDYSKMAKSIQEIETGKPIQPSKFSTGN